MKARKSLNAREMLKDYCGARDCGFDAMLLIIP
jgi:hypothetical protein